MSEVQLVARELNHDGAERFVGVLRIGVDG